MYELDELSKIMIKGFLEKHIHNFNINGNIVGLFSFIILITLILQKNNCNFDVLNDLDDKKLLKFYKEYNIENLKLNEFDYLRIMSELCDFIENKKIELNSLFEMYKNIEKEFNQM
tara:strand:- start:18947 stop:19294 length:348 start_codon:yes stop_codon:yes gene_type:complete